MAKTQRKVPLQILHLAMPKTGSVSMIEAYKLLGFSTYHGFDFMDRPSDQIQWEKAIDARYYGKGKPFEKEDFDAFLGGFEVLSDFPMLGFTEDLLDMYPQAKVVLVERDLEKWYTSFNTHIIAAGYTWMVAVMIHILDPYFMRSRPATLIRKMEYAMFHCHDRASFQANARETYRKHYELVRKRVPKERLLDYKLGSGWEPLCEFLDKPVPDCEFPFKNESKEFAVWMRNTQVRVLKEGLLKAADALQIVGFIMIAMSLLLKLAKVIWS